MRTVTSLSRRRIVPAIVAMLLSVVPATAAAGPTTDTLLVAGDIASCTSEGDTLTGRLVAAQPGIVVTTGDNAYPRGSLADFGACYAPTWGPFRDRTRPVPGNHDWATPGAAGYFGYFGGRAGPKGRGYYRFDVGTWRIYMLSSDCWAVGGCSVGSPQWSWLRDDLSWDPHPCVAAVWHHPRFSSGPHGDSTAALPMLRLLYRHGAELVLNGHDHTYERFAPAGPDGVRDDQRGIRQFVVGTGGAPSYALPGEPAAHSEVRASGVFGVLRLTLGERDYRWEFLPVEGQTFTDSGTDRCH